MSGGCCLRQYMYAPVHGPAAAKDKERCCVRLRRFCVKEITSLAALCVLALLAAALARNGMRWWASGAPCAARNCNECARASHCVWCEGPTLGGSRSELPMPGYCEEADQTGASTCTAGLDAAACAAEGAKEDPWAVCRANVSSSAFCHNVPGCVWCEASSHCIPDAAEEWLCASSESPSLTDSSGLTADSPACASSGVWSDRSNDGDARLVRMPLNISEGYREGLVCTWVLECPFNETVQVRFSRVSLERWDALRIVDGWDATIADETLDWGSQVLAYYTSVSGERIMPVRSDDDGSIKKLIGGVGELGTNALNRVLTPVDISVSVSGGRSARQAQSYGPVLSIELQSGTSAARKMYSQQHGALTFPGGAQAIGFEATYRCATADAKCRDFTTCVFSSPLLLWWILAIGGLRLAYKHIFYGAKSDGLWNVDPEQLHAIAAAMNGPRHHCGHDGNMQTDSSATGEFVAAITQSERLPKQMGREAASLALSSMEELANDDHDHAWVDISWWSPLFLLDVISCCACCWEGFSDLLFATLQFKRPNGDGMVTGSLSLTITAFSTFMFLSPRGEGISAGLGVRHFMPYQEAKRWVYRHARLRNDDNGREGKPLQNADDWQRWLKTPQGRHRPHDLSSHPDKDYHHVIQRPKLGRSCCTRCCRWFCRAEATEWSPRDRWEGWSEFFKAPLLLSETDPEYDNDKDELVKTGWNEDELLERPRVVEPSTSSQDGQNEPSQSNREPGWLCGEPPTNKWDSDVDQLLYGRPPDWLMILLTLLQLRVPVEGLIAWRNVKMLKRRSLAAREQPLGRRCGIQMEQVATEVRAVDWHRARVDLDKALLREGIFEILPQTVLEFQNLWTDRMTVLDLMSVPGFPLATWVSEYHQCYLIMLSTIITASLDLTTPYSAQSAVVGMMLYISVVLQLTARLFVFGSMLSLQHCGENDSLSTGITVAYFLCTYFATLGIHNICFNRGLYHESDFRERKNKAKTEYEVKVCTGVGLGASLHKEHEEGVEARWQCASVEVSYCQCIERAHDGTSGSSGSSLLCFLGSAFACYTRCRGERQQLLEHKKTVFVADSWVVEDMTQRGKRQRAKPLANDEEWVGVKLDYGEAADADGMDQLNMTHVTAAEKQMLFSFINCFTCTDKNITVAPTSLGSLLLSALRVLEATLVCWLFSPSRSVPESKDTAVDAVCLETLAGLHFYIKPFLKTEAFLAIFVQVGSFCCLLAAAAAEKRLRKNSQDMTQRNTDRQHGHDRGEIRDNDGNSHADRGLKLWVRLHGHDSKKTEWTADWTSAASFAAGDTASQTIECEEDIGTVTQVDLCLMRTEQGVECVAQQQPRYQQAADAEQQAPHGRSATWCEDCGYKLGITSLCLLLVAVLAILGSALRMLLHADLTANGWQHGMFGVGRDGSGRPVHLPQPLAFSCRTVVLLALLTTSAVVLGCIQLAGSTQLFWGSPRSRHSSCEQLILVALLCGFVGVAGWLGMAEAQLGNRVASLAWTQANQTTDLFDPAAVNDILDDVVTTLASQC